MAFQVSRLVLPQQAPAGSCHLLALPCQPQGPKTSLPQENTESLGTQHEKGSVHSEKLCVGGGGGGGGCS